MKIQMEFDRIIGLLQEKRAEFPQAAALLDSYLTTEVSFTCSDDESLGITKGQLLQIYEFKAGMEAAKKEQARITGFDHFLPRLRETVLKQIYSTDIATPAGSFLIFHDFDKKEMVGLLLSRTTLQEKRTRMESQRKLNRNDETFQQEQVFRNGCLVLEPQRHKDKKKP